MKKTIWSFGCLILLITTLIPKTTFAISGACSSHGGVNCGAGADWDGSVICYDGWRDSSVSYYSMIECSYSSYSTPTYISCPLNSYYNSLYDSCQCYSGYIVDTDIFGNESCVSGNSYCWENYGYGSEYDSLSKSCGCSSGYVWDTDSSGDQTCSSCFSKYGFYSTYDYLSDSCTCMSGYEFGYDLFGNVSCIKTEPNYESYYTDNSFTSACPDTINGYLGTNGQCYCNTGFKWDSSTGSCIAEIYTCSSYGLHAYAIGNLCYCESGYQWNSDKSACIQDVINSGMDSITTDTSSTKLDGQYDPLKQDTTLMTNLSGSILLQVESHGEAWYVNPSDQRRYYMRDGKTAYEMMRSFGLGITDENLNAIPSVNDTDEMNNTNSACLTNKFAQSVKGKILLQVQQHGEAWYVYPEKCKKIYMKDGDAAYTIMRYLGLGITNEDLSKMPSSEIQ